MYPHELKLEVVFPSPELTPQEMKTWGKVHYGGHQGNVRPPIDLVPAVAQERASLS